MKRTSISLPDDLAQTVEREARRRSTSVSEVTRDALTMYFGLTPGEPRELPVAALGHSGHQNTGRAMEELLERKWDDDARGR